MKLYEVLSHLPSLPAGPDFVSAAKAGLTPHPTPVRVPNITKKMLKEQPIVTIPINKLTTGQGYVLRSGVQKALDNPSPLPITLVDQDGHLVIVDGNHRVAAAILRGDTTIPAQIFPARAGKQRR